MVWQMVPWPNIRQSMADVIRQQRNDQVQPLQSFYPSPRMAAKALKEKLAYGAAFDPDRQPFLMATIHGVGLMLMPLFLPLGARRWPRPRGCARQRAADRPGCSCGAFRGDAGGDCGRGRAGLRMARPCLPAPGPDQPGPHLDGCPGPGWARPAALSLAAVRSLPRAGAATRRSAARPTAPPR